MPAKGTKLTPAKVGEDLAMQRIALMVHLIRGEKVMLDSDLASLYGVQTKALNQAVQRNIDRFPQDLMFQLSPDEKESLRSQFVTFKRGEHCKYLPMHSPNDALFKITNCDLERLTALTTLPLITAH